MKGCPKCGGMMFPDVAVDFYERVFFEKCANCGKVVEIGSIKFSFRQDNAPADPDVLPANHPLLVGRA